MIGRRGGGCLVGQDAEYAQGAGRVAKFSTGGDGTVEVGECMGGAAHCFEREANSEKEERGRGRRL